MKSAVGSRPIDWLPVGDRAQRHDRPTTGHRSNDSQACGKIRFRHTEREIGHNRIVDRWREDTGDDPSTLLLAKGPVRAHPGCHRHQPARSRRGDFAGANAGHGAGNSCQPREQSPFEDREGQPPRSAILFIELATTGNQQDILRTQDPVTFVGMGDLAADRGHARPRFFQKRHQSRNARERPADRIPCFPETWF